MSTPLVSVVIVTWNRRDDVLEAVRSVYAQAYDNYEVIVADNGSTDGTAEALRQEFPTTTVIALDRNSGAAAGRNVGIVAARGEIVFILDSDASLDRETLGKVVARFGDAPALGVLTCKVLNPATGTLDLGAWIYAEKDKADQDRPFLSYSFCEGAAGIRREVFNRAGLFWDVLFFGREGDDLSLRIWDAGYEVLYWPEAIVYHRAAPGTRVAPCQRHYFDLRNSLLMMAVRYPWWLLAWYGPVKIGTALVKGIKLGCLRAILRALYDVARRLPRLQEQRHPISDATARRYLRLQREHGPLRWDLASWLAFKSRRALRD